MNPFDGGYYRTYSCPHERHGAEPCAAGCHSGGNERIVSAPPSLESREVTCPACLTTGIFHDHGCRYCGGWECGCEAYREAISDAAKVAHEYGERAFEQEGAIAAGAIERKIRALTTPPTED
mgnify:CR=1 FL=1